MITSSVTRVVSNLTASRLYRFVLWNDDLNKVVGVCLAGNSNFSLIQQDLQDERKWVQHGNTWVRIPPIVVDRHIEELKEASNNGALVALVQHRQVVQDLYNTAVHNYSLYSQSGDERGCALTGNSKRCYKQILDLLDGQINQLKGTK